MSVSITIDTNITCYGSCNGVLTAIVSKANPPYTYLWSDNQTDSTATGLCADTFYVTVTDIDGCTATATYTISQPDTLTSSITDTIHLLCNSVCIGSATVTPVGGTPPYAYLWSDSQTDSTATNLCAGTYYITVTDTYSCVLIVDSITITQPDTLTAIFTDTTMIGCGGGCTGSATITPTGGTPPYLYLWSNGQTDSTATNLCDSIYSVTVTDNNFCTTTDAIVIVDTSNMVLTFTDINNVSCNGDCNGSATASVSGGTPPYSYLWTDGQTDSTATGLCAGIQYVTVTDICETIIDSVAIIQPDDTLTAIFTDTTMIACGGGCTGSATITPTGGTPPYSYLWSNGQTDSTATNLCDSIYSVTVTDNNLCTTTDTIVIVDTSDIVLTITDINNINCNGDCDGSATANVSGGTPPYSYLWSDGQTDSTAINLCDTIYSVTVTDDNSCIRIIQVDIVAPDSLTVSITETTSTTCFNECTGSVTAAPIGGTPTYTYNWYINDSIFINYDSVAANLCEGNHSVIIIDDHGCSSSELPFTITSLSNLTTASMLDSATCSSNTDDGAIYPGPYGGIPPYSYIWSNDSTTQDLEDIVAGEYSVTITDSLGCEIQRTFTVPHKIEVYAFAGDDDTICRGETIQLEGTGYFINISTGQTSDITYFEWNSLPEINNDTTDQTLWVTPDTTTIYYFTTWDDTKVCYDIDAVTIEVPPLLDIYAGDDISIQESSQVNLEATILNDNIPEDWLSYIDSTTYFWELMNGDIINDNPIVATPMVTGIYIVQAITPIGCIEIDTITVTIIDFIIPSGITPNGDGINDTWIIMNEMSLSYYPNVVVLIYNRWGEKIWQSAKGYPVPWDGKTLKGKDLPMGTYYFIIDFNDESKTKPITGPITIIK